uniref:Transmembrane protein n=1 Tax=Tetraselmis sp. GSL018 TaxID=582737 RepID=A0A061SD95_9CHLO|mmetsp:Transcript_42954/g.101997  ORF Transcript_42954/g.101997 Transcript_42954/m.101997 type:complete len:238 (-) Transcript_42954:117-830(-)
MGRAGNPEPKYRQSRKGRSVERWAMTSVGVCLLAVVVAYSGWQTFLLGEKVLKGAATDMAHKDLEEGLAAFEQFHNHTLQALYVFRRKAYPEFQEKWSAASEGRRRELLEGAQKKVTEDPMFEGLEGLSSGASSPIAGLVPEFFSSKAGFLAHDAEAFKSALGRLLRREENEGISDAEVEEWRRLAQGEKEKMYNLRIAMRLAARSLVMSKFALTLAADVMSLLPSSPPPVAEAAAS